MVEEADRVTAAEEEEEEEGDMQAEPERYGHEGPSKRAHLWKWDSWSRHCRHGEAPPTKQTRLVHQERLDIPVQSLKAASCLGKEGSDVDKQNGRTGYPTGEEELVPLVGHPRAPWT